MNYDNGDSRGTWKAINLLLNRKSKITGITKLKIGESDYLQIQNRFPMLLMITFHQLDVKLIKDFFATGN